MLMVALPFRPASTGLCIGPSVKELVWTTEEQMQNLSSEKVIH